MRIIQQLFSRLWLAVAQIRPKEYSRPKIIKHNLHPHMKRAYGKVLAGGRGLEFRLLARPLAAVLVFLVVVAASVLATAHLTGMDPGALLADPAVLASSVSLRQAKAKLLTKAREIMDRAEEEERDRSEDERNEITALHQQAADLDEDIAIVEAQEAHEADMGRSLGTIAGRHDSDPASPAAQRQARDEFSELTTEQRGLAVARVVRAMAAGKGDLDKSAAFAAKHWGEDDVAYRALAATDEVAGGFAVPDPLAASVIELLTPMSVIRSLNPTVVPMGSGTLRLPKLAGGATAGYIGENDNAPKTEQTFGQVVLTFKKLAALVPVSNDLLRYATPNVDQLVRDDLTSAMARRGDLAFIRGQGTENAPKGLRHWAPAASVINANGTVNLTNVTTDLGKLILVLEEGDVRMLRPGWVMAPRTKHYLMTVRDGNGNFAFRDEMLQGTLWGYPFRVTTQIPTNLGGGGDESEVYFADFADVVIGEAVNLLIDASREAAYHDGTSVQAAFSRDQTVVRSLQEHDFVMRHDESVAVLDQVTWGA